MRIVLALSVALLAFAPLEATAKKGGPFGLGIMIGDPAGLSAKYTLDSTHAVDAGLGFSVEANHIHLHADYLFHFGELTRGWPGGEWLPYVGIGGKVWLFNTGDGDDDGGGSIGVRVPFGLALHLNSAPIDFFLEIVPGLRVLPGTSTDIDGALGARFWF